MLLTPDQLTFSWQFLVLLVAAYVGGVLLPDWSRG